LPKLVYVSHGKVIKPKESILNTQKELTTSKSKDIRYLTLICMKTFKK